GMDRCMAAGMRRGSVERPRPLFRAGAKWQVVRRRRGILLALFFTLAHLAGVLTSVRAIMEVRTAQGTIAWVFALNTVPYLSVPAYWVFGRSKFQGYVLARRADLTETHPIGIQYKSNL